MMTTAAPIPRIARSRRDDRYEAGRPTPEKRAFAGYVVGPPPVSQPPTILRPAAVYNAGTLAGTGIWSDDSNVTSTTITRTGPGTVNAYGWIPELTTDANGPITLHVRVDSTTNEALSAIPMGAAIGYAQPGGAGSIPFLDLRMTDILVHPGAGIEDIVYPVTQRDYDSLGVSHADVIARLRQDSISGQRAILISTTAAGQTIPAGATRTFQIYEAWLEIERPDAAPPDDPTSDTVNVEMLGEVLTGVVYLDERPVLGDIVEVESRGDLLVIENRFTGPPSYPWQKLPDVQRTMVPAGYTTPQGTNGWAPSGTEFGLHSQRLSIYTLNGPVFNPISTYDDPAAWDCLYPHVWKAESGSPYFNNPTTSSSWSGSAMCEPLHGPTLIGAQSTSGVNGASWRIATYSSGGADYIKGECRATAVWINLSAIKTSHLGHISSPSGGLPNPVPPAGMVLEWENPTAALTKIEAAISEPTTNTNTGTVYMLKRSPGDGKYGPVDPTGASLNWYEGNAEPGGSIVPGYSGGEAPWTDVTSEVNETGRTWLLFESSLIHNQERPYSGTHFAGVTQVRLDLRPAFRFSVSPSRYRFVPAGGA